MTSYILWEEDDKVSLRDVSRGDREDVWVRELIQDVQLVSCIVLPNFQWNEFCCVRLLSGIVEALIDSPILTPEGEGEEGLRERDGREERVYIRERDRRESLLEHSTLNDNSYVEVNSTHPHTVVKSHESHMTTPTHPPPNLLQQLVAMLKRFQEKVGVH